MTLIFSNRAINLLQASLHRNSALKIWKCNMESDKILTLQYPPVHEDELQQILNEGLATLLENKTLRAVFDLSFREFESFLRDQNHLSAFSDDSDSGINELIENSFISTKMRVLASALAELLKKMTIQMPHSSDKLAQRNRQALWISEKISSFIPIERRWEIVLYEDDVLFLKASREKWSQQELEVFFPELWAQLDLLLPLKVVAVP